MNILNLPLSSGINKTIPKNSFDKFTNSKQKKLFSEFIDKIKWANKLSSDTINLSGIKIHEIQVFEVTLKKAGRISDLLQIIDRVIPYHIIFIVFYDEDFMLSASHKHPHPTNNDVAVIDWNFSSEWISKQTSLYQLNLRQTLDFVFTDFCNQLVGKTSTGFSVNELIIRQRRIYELGLAIRNLEAQIKSSRQFNKKVELNLKLQDNLAELASLSES